MFSFPLRFRVSAIAAVLFFVAALVAGGLTLDRQQDLMHRALDTLSWNLYQFDRSVHDLRIKALETTPENVGPLVLAYDITYGRSQLMHQGQTRRFMTELYRDTSWSAKVEQEVVSLEPLMESLDSGEKVFDEEVRRTLLSSLTKLQQATREMLLEHTITVAKLRSDDSRAMLHLYAVVLACIVLIMLAGSALVVLLIREARGHTLKAELLEAQSQALREAVQQAEAASRAKSDFMAMVSHEMRTPLSGVIGMTDLIKDEPLSEEGRHYVESLEASAKGLHTVINDVLDYTRIEAGHMGIEDVPFNLVQMLNQLAQGYRIGSNDKVQFLMRLAPRLPECVKGDEHRLRQVLMNLLDNAFKFTDQGFVMLRVTQVDARGISFVVYDTGCGIGEQDLGHIFEPFQQVDSVMTRRHEGAGLGLAIARRLVQAMGGELLVDSQLGSGSRFWFELPLVSCEEECRAAEEEVHTDLPAPHHVLVVEDNAANRQLMAAMLSRLGQSSELVSSGEQALAVLSERSFDMVFMDLQMSGMDGIETASRWRMQESQDHAQGTTVPMIAVTANILPEHRQASVEAGMDDMISKPFTRKELSRVLQRYPSHVYARLTAGSVLPEVSQEGQCHEREEGEEISAMTLNELRSMMSADALQRMVHDYLAHYPVRLARMRVAIEDGDCKALGEEAKRLNNASATLGCAAIMRAAMKLKRLAADGESAEQLTAEVDELERYEGRVREAWRKAGLLESSRPV
ncbi:ATP-binding protein [Halomonas binhaiensis]|uniref:histidine kinase n=1 Tax=Halomonas binhaiensis TaxID=2562282 RepID=A0A856QRB1_9GAMM|nr:ATP-binding protein [Halomonas binhaiensis]QEM82518.2 response regulator [Halomonas binhaiensis]